ncbi:U-box domain-containing protein [Seminavis robusta]|uniref:U-box domain-containing protein n=1 Tax=Seminavis robusta TaxID=568900 RepID=A0A9N8DX96_9STRA|nr:U-box domain-containing protein [Seminavis robusta]|eukprot:Sro445_g144520.1 U-box domain-containing protein (173) ;mRNA; r:33464-33982
MASPTKAASLSIPEAEDEEEVPSAYLCPISLQIMSHPVTDPSSGHSFESATIMEWLDRGKQTNPFTRRPLRSWELVQNKELRQEILIWKKDHGYSVTEKQSAEGDHVPWYRRKPSPDTTPPPPPLLATSIPTAAGNSFMQRLIEAQRRDAEFRKRLNMAVSYSYSNNRRHFR